MKQLGALSLNTECDEGEKAIVAGALSTARALAQNALLLLLADEKRGRVSDGVRSERKA